MSLATHSIRVQAEYLVRRAEALGVTLRIDLAPQKPLAMGNHIHRVEAWPARHRDDPKRQTSTTTTTSCNQHATPSRP
jgi:hypothetical protein